MVNRAANRKLLLPTKCSSEVWGRVAENEEQGDEEVVMIEENFPPTASSRRNNH